MRVYKVSPIVKYSPFFTLTYVSKEDFSVGNIVPINFNNRDIFAVVLESYSLKDAKVEIRKADFQTKKIEKRAELGVENFLEKKLFEVLQRFAKENIVSVGELVWFIFETSPTLTLFASGPFKRAQEIPSKDIIYYPDELSLKVSKSKKEKEENIFRGNKIFKQILENSFETLTIKDFNFDKYLDFQAPHISKLDLLFTLLNPPNPPLGKGGVKITKDQKIILETDFLGVVEKNFLDENIFDGKLFGKYELEVNEKRNIAKKFLVKVGRDKNGEEEVFAKEAVDLLKPHLLDTWSNPPINRGGTAQKVFVFVLSHGFADRIFCNDCKKSYDCESCGHPFSVLNEEEGRFLFCKNCKNKKVLLPDQYLICKHCGSWKIFPFGIGGQKVVESLTSLKENIILIDESEKKLSVKKLKSEIESFLHTSRDVLVGSLRTLKVLQNMNSQIDKTFIISTGPLVRGKYFDSDEKLLKLISEIENISKEVYINKRDGDEISLENYKDKKKFIEEEIAFRKKSGLPPDTKILSLIFNYKNKKHIDKFLIQNMEEFKNAGEIKKGQNYVYFWFVKPDSPILKVSEVLRQFGDAILANSIIEQSILEKK